MLLATSTTNTQEMQGEYNVCAVSNYQTKKMDLIHTW